MELKELAAVSRKYGQGKDYVIAGGGNTSVKIGDTMYVKASGFELGKIDENGFVALSMESLKKLSVSRYSDNELERENQVKSDLLKSRIFPEKNQRPSVEASVHDAIRYKFVVHLHPTVVNGLLCAHQSESLVKELFPESVYLPYITPGYILFKEVERQNELFKNRHGYFPKVFFLENHGIFAGAETIDEIDKIYDEVVRKIKEKAAPVAEPRELPIPYHVVSVLPAIRAMLSGDTLKIARIRNNTLIEKYISDPALLHKIDKSLTPDGIVYCKPYPLYLENKGDAEALLQEFSDKLKSYRQANNHDPKIILIKGMGLIAVEDNSRSVDVALDVFEDVLKVVDLAENFGGVRPMSPEAIRFIVNWEVEAYRKGLMSNSGKSQVANKVVIVTGGGQGFGKGIAEGLMAQGANIVIADVNQEAGERTIQEFSDQDYKNIPLFVKTNIVEKSNLENLVYETVKHFGGIDTLISNAGVLRAGSLDELSEEDFDLVTKVNYKGYFMCAKHISPVMKLQHKHNGALFMDIIQINSKSGLQGSNKNYAYAGGKFGGIGLTQSFALELAPFNIKVNAICPGNFFEGPLWSDPDKGLFAQYLATGKAPGARTVADVKRFYESKVPLGRGCYPEDVVKAVIYAIDQKYETGQAIAVSGGQVMLK